MEKTILKIGVTGSAGSGKSLVCRRFKNIGLVTLDCDQIAREIVEPGQPAFKKVVALFGETVIGPEGSLDRAGLRKIILAQPDLRRQLEGILHPGIIAEMVRQMENADYTKELACAVEVPLLFELKMEGHFDVTVAVTSQDAALVQRIAARDKVSPGAAAKMLALQMPQDEKMTRADHVIQNTGDEDALTARVDALWQSLKKQRLTNF